MKLLRPPTTFSVRGVPVSAAVVLPAPSEEMALRGPNARERLVRDEIHPAGDGATVTFFMLSDGRSDAVFAAGPGSPAERWTREDRDAVIAELARLIGLVVDEDLQ